MADKQKEKLSDRDVVGLIIFIFFGFPLLFAFLLPIPQMVIKKILNPSAPMETHPMFKEPRPLTAQDRLDMYYEDLRENRRSTLQR